jgi:alkanesulfonate monooxygenase SsuD/methylene tetrahydromethanopterin reductase-like flavin-dependent oxidoreductase (luciferase family)
MRYGLFCTYENPHKDFRAAFTDQTRLVQQVEALGFDDAFLAEHHFNPDAASPSCLSLLSYLAGKTSRIRLGSAAVLLPFRNPILTAEEIATLDILCNGRFDFGVAKGGPFPTQTKHLGPTGAAPTAMMQEALDLVTRLLRENHVRFDGRYYSVDGVTLVPKPQQKSVPTFVATSTPETIRWSAQRGYGIMAAAPFPLSHVAAMTRAYRETEGAGDPNLVLIRFYHLASTRDEAISEAKSLLGSFVERMQATTAAVKPEWAPWFDLERLVADSLVGTPEDIAIKASRIEKDIGPRTLCLKPIALDLAKRMKHLDLFANEIFTRMRAAA